MHFMLLIGMGLIVFIRWKFIVQRGYPRDRKVFLWDSMKQLAGGFWLHALNLLFEPARGACEAYLLTIVLDTIVGTLLLYRLLAWTKLLFSGRPTIANFGNYKGHGTEMLWSIWRCQTLAWVGLVTLMKLTLVLITFFTRTGNLLGKVHSVLLFLFHMAEGAVSVVINPNQNGELLLVIVLVPTALNLFQFFLLDDLIQEDGVARDSAETRTLYLKTHLHEVEVLCESLPGLYVADKKGLQDQGPGLAFHVESAGVMTPAVGRFLFWGSSVQGESAAAKREGWVKCTVSADEAMVPPEDIGDRHVFMDWIEKAERSNFFGLSCSSLDPDAFYEWMRVPTGVPIKGRQEHVLKCLHILRELVHIWNRRLSKGTNTLSLKVFKEMCAGSWSLQQLFKIEEARALGLLRPRRRAPDLGGRRELQELIFQTFRVRICRVGSATFADVLKFMLQDAPDDLWDRVYRYKLDRRTETRGSTLSFQVPDQAAPPPNHIPMWGFHELPKWAYDKQVGEFYNRHVAARKSSQLGAVLLAKTEFQAADGQEVAAMSEGEVMEINWDDESEFARIRFADGDRWVDRWVSKSNLEEHLETPKPVDCEWMFGDVHACAHWIPWHWSGPLSLEEAIARLQALTADRPIHLKVPANSDEGHVAFRSVQEAIGHLAQQPRVSAMNAGERLHRCIQNVKAHRPNDGVRFDGRDWQAELVHVLSGNDMAGAAQPLLGAMRGVAELVDRLDLPSIEEGDWIAVKERLKRASWDLDAGDVDQVPLLADCVGPAIQNHAAYAILGNFGAMVFMPFVAYSTMTCKQGGFADHVAIQDLLFDVILLAVFVGFFLIPHQSKSMKYAILSLLGATKEFVFDAGVTKIRFCKYPYTFFLGFFYMMSIFNVLNLWTSAEVLGRVITTFNSCQETADRLTLLWEQLDRHTFLERVLDSKVPFEVLVVGLYLLVFAQPLMAFCYAVPRSLLTGVFRTTQEEEVTYDVGEEGEDETGVRKHANYRTLMQTRASAGANHHTVLAILGTLASWDAVHFQDLRYGSKMIDLHLKKARDVAREIHTRHGDHVVEKNGAPAAAQPPALSVSEHAALCAELARQVKLYYQTLLSQLQRNWVKLFIIGILQNAVQTKVQITILALNTNLLGGVGAFAWATWDTIDPLFFAGVVLNIIGFLCTLLDFAEACTWAFKHSTIANVLQSPPQVEPCTSRMPVVGDKVQLIVAKSLVTEALVAGGGEGGAPRWRLPESAIASVVEVDADGDFRLARAGAGGPESNWLLRRNFHFANDKVARDAATRGGQLEALLSAPHVTFRPDACADISYLQLRVSNSLRRLAAITIFIVLFFVYQVLNFIMFFGCHSRIWNLSLWPPDGCWEPPAEGGLLSPGR